LRKRCHVTGANGFIGSSIVRALLARDYEVVACVGVQLSLANLEGLDVEVRELDLLDPESVRRDLRDGELLIHTAANYSFWLPDPEEMYRVNAFGTRNVLSAALEFGYRKVVHTSTCGTLTPAFAFEGKQIDEESLTDLRIFGGDYKASKLMAEIAALRLAAQGLPLCTIHPSTVLGPGDRRPTPTGEMIVHYINGRMKAFVDMGHNIAHVDDIAMGHLLALEGGRPGRRYVLGGEFLSMRQVVEELADITGIAAPRFAIPNGLLRAAGRANTWVSTRITKRPPLFPYEAALHARDNLPFDSSRAIEELGWSPRPARAVLESAVEWFVSEGRASDRMRRRIEAHVARRVPGDRGV
jgi:dihydroflavonol-4-reductase